YHSGGREKFDKFIFTELDLRDGPGTENAPTTWRRRTASVLKQPLLEPAGLLLMESGWAKPERETRGHCLVGPPSSGRTMRDRCKEDRAADEGGDPDDPIFGCLNWLLGCGMSPHWGWGGSLNLCGGSRDIG
ncbi:hypothetical protein AMECASPLE_021624, partial [Ameca splendens]